MFGGNFTHIQNGVKALARKSIQIREDLTLSSAFRFVVNTLRVNIICDIFMSWHVHSLLFSIVKQDIAVCFYAFNAINFDGKRFQLLFIDDI